MASIANCSYESGRIVMTLAGRAAGTTTITARTTDDSGVMATCKVTVTKPTDINGINISEYGYTYYTLDGIRLNSRPRKEGVYIREKDGRREKVVVRRK